MRELSLNEVEQVSGGFNQFWEGVGFTVAGIYGIAAGTALTIETGGAGIISGGSMFLGGLASLNAGFNDFYNNISSYFQ